jgi:hypothetical protein
MLTIERSATGESVMHKGQWRGIVSVLLALSLVVVWAAGTAVAQTKVEICDNKIDDDGDGFIDGADPDCQKPPPPPSGTPCSPGFWKNHSDEFNAACGDAAALAVVLGLSRLDSCPELLGAVSCKGSDASCLRSLAAALLNTVSGCQE